MIDGMVKAEATAQDIPRPARKGAIKNHAKRWRVLSIAKNYLGFIIMDKETQLKIRRRKNLARARMIRAEKIQASKRREAWIDRSNFIRWVGLVGVQGSSALVLFDFGLLLYWSILWLGLCCYQFSAIVNLREAVLVANETKAKFESGKGSSQETVTATRKKIKQERPYIVGNTIGMILVGWNIINMM